MRFLKADVDLRLLILILVILTVFVGSSIYYQNKIEILQREYDEKVEHLKMLEEKLLLKEEKLNEITELKGLVEKDKEVLEISYLSLQSENQNLEVEKTNLIETSKSAPFGKTICKATGDVQCLN